MTDSLKSLEKRRKEITALQVGIARNHLVPLGGYSLAIHLPANPALAALLNAHPEPGTTMSVLQDEIIPCLLPLPRAVLHPNNHSDNYPSPRTGRDATRHPYCRGIPAVGQEHKGTAA
jgi:hypothetical protein